MDPEQEFAAIVLAATKRLIAKESGDPNADADFFARLAEIETT